MDSITLTLSAQASGVTDAYYNMPGWARVVVLAAGVVIAWTIALFVLDLPGTRPSRGLADHSAAEPSRPRCITCPRCSGRGKIWRSDAEYWAAGGRVTHSQNYGTVRVGASNYGTCNACHGTRSVWETDAWRW